MSSNREAGCLAVSELQKLKFSQLPLHHRVTIKKKGRSTPDIQISQPGISNNKKYIRSFNSDWYQRKNWLCGCEVKNSLFCFPCLLFGGDATWTKDGFRNMNKIKDKTEKHEMSKKHIENVVSLALLGTVSMKDKQSDAYKTSVNEHYQKVKKNREILSKVIDFILSSGNFHTPVNPLTDKDDTINPAMFRKLLSLACDSDADFKNNLESEVFKGVSKAIQNEVLDCLLDVYHEEIKVEVRKASFVTVMADDVTDVSDQTQLSICLRYVMDGELYERFWGLYVPESQTANGLAECILEQLAVILVGNEDKLIAQTFDGISFMKGKKSELKEKIKAVYANSQFVLGYTHDPNTMLKNAASTTPNARMFFAKALAIPTFFSKSPHRVTILKKHMKVGLSHTAGKPVIWSISKIHESLKALKNCMAEILSEPTTDETVAEATAILNNLNDNEFLFWLELFYQISPNVETLYNQMQSKEINSAKAGVYLKNFKSAISKLKDSKYCGNRSKELAAEAKEICDNLRDDMMVRYSFIAQFLAAKLFNKKCFANFRNTHPIDDISQVAEAYPIMDKEKLDTELKVFYSRSDLHECGKLIDLLKFILENKLDEVLVELKKLIEIQLTLPMTTMDTDRCPHTLSKVQSFLRSTFKSEKLNPLAVLSIENDYLRFHPDIKEKIIDLFSQIKTRKSDFCLK